MEIVWRVLDEDIVKIKKFYSDCRNHPFVMRRKKRNIEKIGLCLDHKTTWKAIVACLLTTQQRSGPNAPITRFLRKKPFSLNCTECAFVANLKNHALKQLSSFGGIRFAKKIAAQINNNFKWLEKGGWQQLFAELNKIYGNAAAEMEREIATFVSENMEGFGPKQSRNLLQTLGLTRYEIPIDSRITKWLNDFGFPIKLSASALGDMNYYHFVLDGVQELAKKCEIFPCLLDAAIFSSFDSEWEGYEDVL